MDNLAQGLGCATIEKTWHIPSTWEFNGQRRAAGTIHWQVIEIRNKKVGDFVGLRCPLATVLK
jgi:hypothetical protein